MSMDSIDDRLAAKIRRDRRQCRKHSGYTPHEKICRAGRLWPARERMMEEQSRQFVAAQMRDEPSSPSFTGDGTSVGFGEAVRRCLARSTVYGRASRSEFWYFYSFCIVANLCSFVVFASLLEWPHVDIFVSGMLGIFSTIAFVRRLHDVNRTGWWIFIAFTIVGIIPLFVWSVRKGDPHANRFDLKSKNISPDVSAPAAAPVATSDAAATIENVERLHRLRKEGAITDEEYQILKGRSF